MFQGKEMKSSAQIPASGQISPSPDAVCIYGHEFTASLPTPHPSGEELSSALRTTYVFPTLTPRHLIAKDERM